MEQQQIRVHRNLHNARKGGPQWVRTERGKVAEYLDSVCLMDVTTRVQPGGVRRCQERQVRAVCAFFDGARATDREITDRRMATGGTWERVAFDPREDDEFMVLPSGAEVRAMPYPGAYRGRWNAADAVMLNPDGACYALNARWED